MSAPGTSRLDADLRHYLQHRTALFPSQIGDVVADVIKFTSSVLQHGFRKAIAQLALDSGDLAKRPLLQICEAIVEHHLRIVSGTDRELVAKSLFEAYIHLAGPQHVFESASTTRFMHSLRRHGAKKFAASFISLHLFNVVCLEMQQEVFARMPDQQSIDLYMFGMEALCRDVVSRAIAIGNIESDRLWGEVVCRNIESQLFH